MASSARITVQDNNPVQAVQEFLRSLLADPEIDAVFTPRRLPARGAVMPSLVTDPAEFDQADPLAPSFPMNAARIVARLTQGEGEGRIAAVLRPCEIRAFVELTKLNQGNMDNVVLVGVDCLGAYDNATYHTLMGDKDPQQATLDFLHAAGEPDNGYEIAGACKACEYPEPVNADLVIGLAGVDVDKELPIVSMTPRGEGILTRMEFSDAGEHVERTKALDALRESRITVRDALFEATTEATNNLEKLSEFLSGCVNCYNCRQACPVCYCKECVFLTDVFDHKPWQYMGWAKRKGSLKLPTDTIFFHMTRLAHMSTACVGCGQCSNACPNNIPVMELFRTVAHATQAAFDYEAGRSPQERPPLSIFREHEFAEVTGGLD